MEAITRFDRRELKFLVDEATAASIRGAIAGHMLPDPHGGPDGRYPIVSIYMDNAEREIYLNHLRGVASRRKVRLRIYGRREPGAGSPSFLEVKHKYNRRTSKRRLATTVPEALGLLRGEGARRPVSGMDAVVLDELDRLIRLKGLEPVCVMRYDREAWTGQGDEADLRLTFDTGLRARARDFDAVVADDEDFDVTLLPPGLAVMEIKVDHSVPFWLAELLGRLGCQPRSNSKYQLAVEALGLFRGGMIVDLPQDWVMGAALETWKDPNWTR